MSAEIVCPRAHKPTLVHHGGSLLHLLPRGGGQSISGESFVCRNEPTLARERAPYRPLRLAALVRQRRCPRDFLSDTRRLEVVGCLGGGERSGSGEVILAEVALEEVLVPVGLGAVRAGVWAEIEMCRLMMSAESLPLVQDNMSALRDTGGLDAGLTDLKAFPQPSSSHRKSFPDSETLLLRFLGDAATCFPSLSPSSSLDRFLPL